MAGYFVAPTSVLPDTRIILVYNKQLTSKATVFIFLILDQKKNIGQISRKDNEGDEIKNF